MTRASYGRQTSCVYCGHDVEWHGKPYRRELVPARGDKPAVTMVSGGWMDRGSDRFCQANSGKYDENGVPMPNRVRLHKGAL